MEMKKKSLAHILQAVIFSGAIAFSFSGCDRDGPMERAGENADRTLERAGESIDRTVRDAGRAIEDAGDEIEDATDGR